MINSVALPLPHRQAPGGRAGFEVDAIGSNMAERVCTRD